MISINFCLKKYINEYLKKTNNIFIISGWKIISEGVDWNYQLKNIMLILFVKKHNYYLLIKLLILIFFIMKTYYCRTIIKVVNKSINNKYKNSRFN